MYEIYIKYDERYQGGDPLDHDDPFSGREDLYIEVEWKHALRSCDGEDWFETVEVDFDPHSVDKVFLCVVYYSSGDTFGRSFGNFHIVGAYSTYDDAKEVSRNIDKLKYKPWEGYFETLEDVKVVSLEIK